ncbi:MAG: response regulator [Spirochaetes bacterium]|nr:response regulator [Spirochaetota bacterium]
MEQRAKRPSKIMIVEDEIIIADLLTNLLRRNGYEVMEVVTTGDDAIRQVPLDRPDLILMDILLIGKLDGIETARQIMERFFIPIIYLTAHADEETIQRATKTASYGYIIKPFNESTIHATIEMALSKHRLEQELLGRNEELQNLTAHMETIREEERKRIAREVHDYLGQALTALRIDSSWLISHLPEGPAGDGLAAKAKTMVQLIDETLENVKNICAELRPGVLDHLGLGPAIEWQCGEIRRRTGIHFAINSIPEEIAVDNDIAVTFFRIFQEIITNAVRHSRATEITVSLVKTDTEMVMTVRDNGIGISEEQLHNPRSIGLIGMRERARHAGGLLHILGEEGSGTKVTLTIPN